MLPIRFLLKTGAIGLLLFSASALSGGAYCGGPANCTNAAGIRTCTYQVGVVNPPINLSGTNTGGAASSCSLAGSTFIARRPTTAAAPGSCNFMGTTSYTSMTTMTFSMYITSPGSPSATTTMIPYTNTITSSITCIIDESSGLPVELMEFSVANAGTGKTEDQ